MAVFIGVAACVSGAVWGQDSADIAKPSPLAISSLPTPPADLGTLIEQGAVTFESGDRDQSLESANGPRVSAETRYRIEYHFRSNAKWDLRGGQLTVRIQFRDIRWGVHHVIWFRRLPETDSFWDNPLVQHEFDHVRISSDPRFRDSFRKRLRANSVVLQDVSSSQRVDDAMVDKIVEQTAKDVFESLSELVAIRYAELDRVTRHGRLPLPSDHGLFDPVSP
ncbi:hypothetical protein [Rubripirellula lacrimiformis]|uniref:hypothetical protein n=1 Tax=Rubripirellula lacrimiformis TaxID=1930273 RepID=UPI0011A98686|nr:hypothetical protein [Rubripirellula lacrimiformis]